MSKDKDGNNRRYKVIFQPAGRQGDIVEGTTLLDAARQLGVEIESICGGHQTCGKCKVAVETGNFSKFAVKSAAGHLTPSGDRERDYALRRNFTPDERLSCACQVTGDLVIRVPPESQTRKQVVRKSVGVERAITVDASMRLYYVELPQAELKDHRGDWERLRNELEKVHGLEDLRIDPAVLPALQPTLADSGRKITVTVFEGREIVRVQPGFHDDLYGIAVDVGTTTIAAHLCHLRTGERLATASSMNPQVSFGEDLMSRVSYAMVNEDGTERMHAAVIEGLNKLIAEATANAGIAPDDIVEIVMVGNTTMHHLFLGINPIELGGAPFSLAMHDALDVKARDLGVRIARGANIHVPPCEAGHVGADNVGVLVAEAPYQQDEQMLVIDIGTNGEILLGNQEKMLSASSPTGPAFEGAQIVHGMRAADGAIERVRIDPETLAVQYKIIGKEGWIESRDQTPGESGSFAANHQHPISTNGRRKKRDEILNPPLKASGICGSGIIEAIAELFTAGVIASNGRFAEFEHPRLRTGLGEGSSKVEFILAFGHETSSGQAITVHSDDVRAIQLGKAALYAGTKLLMNRLGLDRVERIALAGGFGSYIDPKHAMILGLIPDCKLENVVAVGNAAGDGARMILLDRSKRKEAKWAARWVRYVETAVEPTFQTEFVGAINIPHASDSFSHLDAYLAECRQKWSTARRQAIDSLESSGAGRRSSQAERDARRRQRRQRRG